MIQLFIKLQYYITLYVIGNLPYSKYVITPTTYASLYEHVYQFLEVCPVEHQSWNIMPEPFGVIQPISEKNFIQILNTTLDTLQQFSCEGPVFESRNAIIADLTNWLNIFYAH